MQLGKVPVFLGLVAGAAVTAAIFGAIHHQMSYSVGPSFFTALYLPASGVPADTAPRLAAALAGAQAAWGIGILAALPALILGFIMVPKPRTYMAAGIGAIGVGVFLALLASLLGLLAGIAADTTGLIDGWLSFPDGPARSDFLRAGFMHDGAVVGALIAALAGLWPMTRARKIDIAMIDADLARKRAAREKDKDGS